MEVGRKHEGDGARILTVSYDLQVPSPGTPEEVASNVERFLKARGWTFPAYVFDAPDLDAINERYDLPGPIPVTLAFDAQGKLVDRASSAKMIELLGTPFLKKTLEDATPSRSFTSVKGKVGIGTWDRRYHDSAIVKIERGSDPARTIAYALAVLGSPDNTTAARKLELAYHDCVVARHP